MTDLRKKSLKGAITNLIIIALVLLLVFILSATLSDNNYRRKLVPIIWQLCIFILLGTSLNLTMGFLGELALGHMGFMGIGAYTAALSSLALERAGMFTANSASPFQLIVVMLGCSLLGALLAAVFSLLLGIPALRLRGDYLAIVTLGFGLIIENVIANLPFAGGNGLAQGTPSSALYQNGLGIKSALQAQYVYFPIILTIVCVAIMFMFVTSKYGRAIKSIREDEIAANASGVNATYYKILTFTISAFFAGLAGGLYAICTSTLTTASFTFASSSIWNSTFIVVLVVIGGMGSLTGSIVAAIGMYMLNYEIKNGAWVAAMPQFIQNLFAFPMLIYAIVLMIVIMFKPYGIMGTYEFSLSKMLFGKKGQANGGEVK